MGIPKFDIVLSEPDLMARIDKLADRLAPRLTGDWSAINILIGATPFTSDLMKALARRDIHPVLDALWLESYRDARESSGRVVVRAVGRIVHRHAARAVREAERRVAFGHLDAGEVVVA